MVESGESLAAFCRRYGLRPARVSRWTKLIRVSEPMRFHPVEVVGRAQSSEARIEVELPGGATVRLPHGFSADDLRHVLAALEESRGC